MEFLDFIRENLGDKAWEAAVEWQDSQEQKLIIKQKETEKDPNPVQVMFWKMSKPYTGTIGGQFSYKFTPTSIGLFATVIDEIQNEEIDLAEFVDY
jgi:hypothetical protein